VHAFTPYATPAEERRRTVANIQAESKRQEAEIHQMDSQLHGFQPGLGSNAGDRFAPDSDMDGEDMSFDDLARQLEQSIGGSGLDNMSPADMAELMRSLGEAEADFGSDNDGDDSGRQ